MCTAVLIGWRPLNSPPPPTFGQQDRRHLFMTPCVVIYEEAFRDSFRTWHLTSSNFQLFFGAPLGVMGHKSPGNKNDENFSSFTRNFICTGCKVIHKKRFSNMQRKKTKVLQYVKKYTNVRYICLHIRFHMIPSNFFPFLPVLHWNPIRRILTVVVSLWAAEIF